MMLQNIAADVKTNHAFEDKNNVIFSDSLDSSFSTAAENTISTSFSAATEDISYFRSFSKIQSFEANFLGKSDDFSLNRNPSSSIYDFTSAHSSQSTKCADNKAAFNKFKFSHQSNYFALSSSALRCSADQGLIANDNDWASSVFNTEANTEESLPEEQLVLPGFAFAQSSMFVSNSSSPLNISESTNLPDELPGIMPLTSSALTYQSNFDPVNQVGSCQSKMRRCAPSRQFTTGSNLNSEASSGHLLEMINCLIEEAEVSKLVFKAKDQEIGLLRKEVDHLKQLSHAMIRRLNFMQETGQNRDQMF